MALEGWRAKIIVSIIRSLVILLDIILLPIYLIIYKPWNFWNMKRVVWAKLEDERDPYGCFKRVNQTVSNPVSSDVETMDKLFDNAVQLYKRRKCYGTRKVLGEEEEHTNSGKVFKKLKLGEYIWMTYAEVDARVKNICQGLLCTGVESKKPIVLLAETRVEWLLTAQACFRINVPVVTLYANLGDDGLVHGINETEVTHVVTSYDLLPKLKVILHRIPKVTHIIYMEGVSQKKDIISALSEKVAVMPYREMEDNGSKSPDRSYTPSQPDDLAYIMYTSGSTGVPKGVMITQKNVITTVEGIDHVFKSSDFKFDESDSHIAYLPAAHILELAAECYLTSVGVKVGYSSPQTLTDYSTAVKRGEHGDIKVLKPTFLVAVPLMLDRIRKSIIQLAGKEGSFPRLMFDFAIQYKEFWIEKGFETPLLDEYLLKTYRDFLGGSVRMVISGSAPLSPETQRFTRACLSVRVVQGYGLTETSASATITDYNDFSIGRVGAPLSTCKIRLVNWEEGKYFATDKPNPRGEIVISGDCLTLGYFKNPTQTQEAYIFEGGTRWFYTGDIGEVFPDGTLKIIDRKKDLVKLQFGEYIALGKVEAELKTYPLIENICVVGNGFQTYLVAIVIPNFLHLKTVAKDVGKENLSFEEMCADPTVTIEVTERIREFGRKCGLFGSELPRKVRLCNDDWSPESGLVTAALKNRRKYIEEHYQKHINDMYSETTVNGQQ